MGDREDSPDWLRAFQVYLFCLHRNSYSCLLCSFHNRLFAPNLCLISWTIMWLSLNPFWTSVWLVFQLRDFEIVYTLAFYSCKDVINSNYMDVVIEHICVRVCEFGEIISSGQVESSKCGLGNTLEMDNPFFVNSFEPSLFYNSPG